MHTRELGIEPLRSIFFKEIALILNKMCRRSAQKEHVLSLFQE